MRFPTLLGSLWHALDLRRRRQSAGLPRKLIVGLGNPEARFEGTPHNLGFAVVTRLAMRRWEELAIQECRAETVHRSLERHEVLLAKPQTYMNLSGESVVLLLEKYRLSLQDLIVICDDLALPFGTIRVRGRGSSGGHRGLQSIIDKLDTTEFVRIRLGIGQPGIIHDAVEYVLTPIPPVLQEAGRQMIESGKGAVEMILRAGVEVAMSRFN